jgi:hypothetical protein
MRTRTVALLVMAFLAVPAAARASLADEQRQGQELIVQLHAGTKTCGDLSADDFDHVGEYLMYRALGSTSLHQAMNDRMTAMMGEQGESRMHQLLGRRYTGCYTSASGGGGYGGMMGPGMMGDYYGPGGSSGMMGSGDWSWMMGGAWQHMTRQDWQRLQQRLLGTSASTPGHSGWSAAAIVAVAVGAVAVVALVVLLLIRRPFRRPPTAAASH